jgi:hypothetical protein
MSKNNGEIVFSIEEAAEGGYVAHALGHSIFTGRGLRQLACHVPIRGR